MLQNFMLTSNLCVALLLIAEVLDQLLNWHVLAVLKLVLGGPPPEMIDENIGIGGDSGHGTGNVVREAINLLGKNRVIKKLVHVSLLGRDENSILSQDSEASSSLANSFHGVFDLENKLLLSKKSSPTWYNLPSGEKIVVRLS